MGYLQEQYALLTYEPSLQPCFYEVGSYTVAQTSLKLRAINTKREILDILVKVMVGRKWSYIFLILVS